MELRCGYRYEFFVSIDDGLVPSRLYIRCPELPAGPESIKLDKALCLGELLKFVASLTGLKNIKPYFMESSSVLVTIIRQRQIENSGGGKITLDDLEPGLNCWLARKGFNERDMKELEQLAGGMVQGLIILLRILPRKKTLHSPQAGAQDPKQIQWEGWNKLDPIQVAAIEKLFQGVRARLKIEIEARANSTPEEFPSHESEDAQLEDLAWVASSVVAPRPENQHHLSRSSSFQENAIQRLTRVTDWSTQGQTSMVYEYDIQHSGKPHNIKLCFVQIQLPDHLNLQAGRLLIKIKIADSNQAHAHMFALDATLEDPACRIAFEVHATQMDGKNIIIYPTRRGVKTVGKVNSLADKIIHGDTNQIIAQRCRRYVNIDAGRKDELPVELQRFFQGGYSADLTG